ncbi:MAG: hypothetical protein ACRELG_26390, partial [Gemmataceae bacterium]
RNEGRPLTPLHGGHTALLAVSSRLDGIFGQGELRHISRWQAVKTILRLEEDDEKGVTTIREKEQFSHTLNLLYVDGGTAVLTADPLAEDKEPAPGNTTAHSAEPVDEGPSVGRKFRIGEE